MTACGVCSRAFEVTTGSALKVCPDCLAPHPVRCTVCGTSNRVLAYMEPLTPAERAAGHACAYCAAIAREEQQLAACYRRNRRLL